MEQQYKNPPLLLRALLWCFLVLYFIGTQHHCSSPCVSLLFAQAFSPASSSTAFSSPTRARDLFLSEGGIIESSVAATSSSGDEIQLLTSLGTAAVLGLGVDPLIATFWNETQRNYIQGSTSDNTSKSVELRDTLRYGAANSVAVAARVWGLLLLVGWVLSHANDWNLISFLGANNFVASLTPQAAEEVGLVVWFSLTLSNLKRYLLQQAVSSSGGLGRVQLVDGLVDFVLATASAAYIAKDVLFLDFTDALKSLFAASGVSALIVSLASQGLANELVGGLLLQAWDNFNVGDHIRLGDGTEGTVMEIGLVETVILQNEIPIRIPNSQLVGQRVSNLSQLTVSQVNQELRFRYSDLDRLPSVLDDIKNEIQSSCYNTTDGDSCDKLIVDGSKPFRVVIVGYKPDHVQVQVLCHFQNVNPSSAEFVALRQRVLLSIASAMQRSHVVFAIPAISYETRGTTTAIQYSGGISSTNTDDKPPVPY